MKRYLVMIGALAVMSWVAGCGQSSQSAPAPKPQPTAGGEDHGHDEHVHGAGPHGGTLADWGGGAYHIEFVVDHDKKEATVYILGSDEKSPTPIKAQSIHLTINEPMTELDLIAQPLEGEAEGTSSRFVGTHDTIGIVKGFAGTISGVIDGTPYTGDFKEEPHGAEHKH